MLGFDAVGRFAVGQIPRSSYVTFPVQPSSFVVTTKTFLFSLKFAPSKSTYVITGNVITFASGSPVIQKLAVLVTGNPLLSNIGLNTGNASYVVTGQGITFSRDFEAWFPRSFQGASWSSESAPSNTWTPATVQPEVWTPE